MSTVNGRSMIEPPLMDAPAAKMHEFVAWLARQLADPTQQVFHVRTTRGWLKLGSGAALRVLRVARRMVNLHAARERIRRACTPAAANDPAVGP
jgi:hypothetical protein